MSFPKETIDLGQDHTLTFVCWMPNRELNPGLEHLPDVEKFGAVIEHQTPKGEVCRHGITFDGVVARQVEKEEGLWVVESWAPLTVSPSLFCNPVAGGCGDHGFIREGKWVKA